VDASAKWRCSSRKGRTPQRHRRGEQIRQRGHRQAGFRTEIPDREKPAFAGERMQLRTIDNLLRVPAVRPREPAARPEALAARTG